MIGHSRPRPSAAEPGVQRAGPPVPRAALQVGVTGHRPNHLAGVDPRELATAVRSVLQRIERAAAHAQRLAGPVYQPATPLLRLVSALAEGADRIVASEALALGFELVCPLPFERHEYERDFADAGSVDEYRHLLDCAGAVLELDGCRETPERETDAYAAVGRVTLSQCDLLIAVWDGEDARGAGGTAEVVQEALTLGLPVVWVRVQAPHQASLLIVDRAEHREERPLDDLAHRVRSLLLPPGVDPPRLSPAGGRDLLATYLRERQPRWTLVGWAWSTFASLAGDLHPRLPRLRVRQFGPVVQREWHREWDRAAGLPGRVIEQVDAALLQGYAWADGLAVYYADSYRSSFVLYYFLGVLATLLALFISAADLPARNELLARLLRAGAFVSVLLILVIWLTSARRRWQERWIDYRLLAESLRQIRFLMLLGRVLPFARLLVSETHSGTHISWPAWYLRAVTRQAGLIDATLTTEYLHATRLLLHDALLEEEARYHRNNARRLERMDTRLRHLGSALFVVALLALGVLVVREAPWVDFVAALLPVLGGALAAIRSQSELGRVMKRSRTMGEQLQSLALELAGVTTLTSETLVRVADTAAQAMVGEVMDWQVVFLEKPLDLG